MLVRVLETTLDAYDDLVDRAEEEIQTLAEWIARRQTPERRSSVIVSGLWAPGDDSPLERELFSEVARLRVGPTGDGSWWLVDRLEAAIGAAQAAADYAAAASWALAGDSRRRTQQLAWVLVGSWVTLAVVAVSVRLSGSLGTGEVDPLLFVGAILGRRDGDRAGHCVESPMELATEPGSDISGPTPAEPHPPDGALRIISLKEGVTAETSDPASCRPSSRTRRRGPGST